MTHITTGADHYGYSIGEKMTALKCYQVTVTNVAQDLATLLGEAIPTGALHMWLDPEAEITLTFLSTQTPVVGTLGVRVSRDILWMNQNTILSTMKAIAGANVKVNIHFFS